MLQKKYLLNFAAFTFAWCTSASAAELTLAEKPLVVTGVAKPNIMILADSSGSMLHIVEAAPYDKNVSYGTCPPGQALNNNGELEADFVWDSVKGVWFNQIENGEGNFSWSLTGGTGTRCFDSAKTYTNVRLHQDTWGFGTGANYSGNFLNWYFSNDTRTGRYESTAEHKYRPGSKTRNEVTIDALTDMVGTNGITGLKGVHMGISWFNSGKARIESGLSDIDTATNRTNLLNKIKNLPASGGTPLNSALASVGRYFIEGASDNTTALTYTNTHVASGKNAKELLNLEPNYASGVTKPTSTVMQYSCQSNIIVAMTDGEPTGDNGYSGPLNLWEDGVEATTNAQSLDPGDLDDVAIALRELDWRPSLYGKDAAENLNNIKTYTVGFGLDIPVLKDAGDKGAGTIDANGVVQKPGFFLAQDSAELTTVFKRIAADVIASNGSVASVAFNSSQLNQDSAVYQAKFDTKKWSGQLEARELTVTGGIATTPAWEAGDRMDGQSASARNIMTFASDGVPFEWANLTEEQKNDLGYTGLPTAAPVRNDVLGQAMLNYLRGDRSLEGSLSTQFRERDSKLGDIVNSTPVYVGKPELYWPDYQTGSNAELFGASDKPYSEYKTAQKDRAPVLYFGANDGMLHGVNAAVTGGGEEVFAYIPSQVFDSSAGDVGLRQLASQSYGHKFFVDLTPTVSDVFINNEWRTILIGGLRAGGRGLFALDVTNPSDFNDLTNKAGSIALWEFDETVDADLGYTFSKPTIAMLKDGSNSGKWAAIFGNGYNNKGDGKAKLFIVFIEQGTDGTWDSGDYIELSTGVGDTTTPNGLSTPRVVDLDGDSVADRVYVGDLRGNVWAFDLTDNNTGNWGLAHGSSPLMTAKDSSGKAQPITSAPIAAINPKVATKNNEPNVMVMFGTGKFLESSDPSNSDTMSYYAVWDKGTGGRLRANLKERRFVTETNPDGTRVRKVTGDAIDWSSDYGWYIDLLHRAASTDTGTAEGERVISDSLLRRKVLFFNTVIPDDTPCKSGGSGWLSSLQFDTGLAPTEAIFDANNDGSIDSGDLNYVGSEFLNGLPAQSGILGDVQFTPGSDGTIKSRKVNVGSGDKEGRLSWEEVYRD
ncbi:hypothetical protein L1F30_14350 [Simiduia sp. 21SJ11W-1]|uniref:pilus assembly protein n=1 Tax=Simiduia sp. 21SJ11W-1 TaxID=2909669 RepID=UPI0020A00B97|nr:PilC/PilY family type IV pilus protein [Simiduia sp. 21SJ11W-1]UTA47332.1 hypothetical protein L1F30_14350 [Simiduia sp. 21SJ11W-1]